VVLITTVYLCIGFFFSNAGYYSNELYPIVTSETLIGKNVLFDAKYADRFEENTVMRAPFIKSFVLERGINHIEISIPLSRDLEDSLISNCPNIKPYHERGLHWRAYFTIGNVNTFDYDSTFSVDGNAKAILDCFKENLKVTIDDSISFDVDFKFSKHDVPDKSKLVGYVPTEGLEPGHHNLGLNAKDIFLKETYYIPFLKD